MLLGHIILKKFKYKILYIVFLSASKLGILQQISDTTTEYK